MRATESRPRRAGALTWSRCGARSPRPRRCGAPLRVPLLLHGRPGVEADHQSLPGGLPETSRPSGWAGSSPSPTTTHCRDVLASASGIGTLHEATGGRPGCPASTTRRCSRSAASRSWSSRCGRATASAGARSPSTARPAVRSSTPGRWPFSAVSRRCWRRGARHGLRTAQAVEPDLHDAPAVVVLDRRLTTVSATPTAEQWLAALGRHAREPPPSLVSSGAGPSDPRTVPRRHASKAPTVAG